MPDPSSPKPGTMDELAGQPLVASDDGGRGVGATLGQDVGEADARADETARRALKAQMDNAHKPPQEGAARGGAVPVGRTPITPDLTTPGLTPGAPVPPATTDLQNSED